MERKHLQLFENWREMRPLHDVSTTFRPFVVLRRAVARCLSSGDKSFRLVSGCLPSSRLAFVT
mgnify:CR=1 FL=1